MLVMRTRAYKHFQKTLYERRRVLVLLLYTLWAGGHVAPPVLSTISAAVKDRPLPPRAVVILRLDCTKPHKHHVQESASDAAGAICHNASAAAAAVRADKANAERAQLLAQVCLCAQIPVGEHIFPVEIAST